MISLPLPQKVTKTLYVVAVPGIFTNNFFIDIYNFKPVTENRCVILKSIEFETDLPELDENQRARLKDLMAKIPASSNHVEHHSV